jgi:hypothetical protein
LRLGADIAAHQTTPAMKCIKNLLAIAIVEPKTGLFTNKAVKPKTAKANGYSKSI